MSAKRIQRKRLRRIAVTLGSLSIQSAWFHLLGELSCKERSDEAGQFVGKRAGSAAAVAKGGAKRRP